MSVTRTLSLSNIQAVTNGPSFVTPPASLEQKLHRALSASRTLMPALPQKIGVIGNHLPRQCGIATFTTDLCDALESEFGSTRLLAVPVTDADFTYQYPSRVQFELTEKDLHSYDSARNFLNARRVDVVCLQHEFGIFGGDAGGHILQLLRQLNMPVVTTLHTVLAEPNDDQRRVMDEITRLSSRLVVMSRHSARLLQSVFGTPAEKIDLIQHGVPDLPFLDSGMYKAGIGAEGKSVLLSFGLLSPNKGIENIIGALPEIAARVPNVDLLIVGATHPHLMRREGDRYKKQLEALAQQLGVESHVKFHHQFVTPSDMAHFVGAADLYITPYRHQAQVSSGTLAYAMGAGKAVISTPYWHAAELLADGRGALVPFEDPKALASKTIELLENPMLRHAMRKRAYAFSRCMVWKSVAHQYMESFQRARMQESSRPARGIAAAACEMQAS